MIEAKVDEKILKPTPIRRVIHEYGEPFEAEIRNRQAAMPDGPQHDGILPYPVVGHPIAIEVRLEGFRIQARGVDLAQPWQQIHEDMLGVLG